MPAINFKKHASLLLSKDMAEICQPFFRKFDYCFLNIIRLYDDGRVFYLCDNQAWLQHYLTNGFPEIGAFEQNPLLKAHEYVLWSSLGETDPILVYTKEIFNVRHGITLIFPFAGGYDYFNFGTHQEDRSILGDMCGQVAELKQFSQLFYEKARRILTQNQKHALALADFNYKNSIRPLDEKLYLGPTYSYNYLTKKELAYLNKLIAGQTIPEIAALAQLSTRTIEKHIENIKEKLNCRTQCELGYQAAKLGIKNT